MAIRATTNSDYLSGTVVQSPITVMTWFRVSALGAFLSPWSIDNNTSFLGPYIDTSNNLAHGFAHGGGDPLVLAGIAVNTWYWMATVYQSGVSGVVFIGTKSGELVGVTDGFGNAGSLPGTSLFVFNESALDQTLNGDVADFMYYDRALSEQEIRAQHGNPKPLSRNKLRFWLPLRTKGAPERPCAGFGLPFTHTGSLGWSSQVPPTVRRSSALFR